MYNDLHVPAVAILAPIINCPTISATIQDLHKKRKRPVVLLLTGFCSPVAFHGYFIMDYPLIIAGTINTSVNVCLIALYFTCYRKSS
jgi:hypothetical protein